MSKGSPLAALARRRHRRKQRRILEYEFPEPLVDKLRERHPHLTTDDAHAVLDGLREWFIVCRYADGKMVGMPSRVVDDAWHEFILMTRRYHGFC